MDAAVRLPRGLTSDFSLNSTSAIDRRHDEEEHAAPERQPSGSTVPLQLESGFHSKKGPFQILFALLQRVSHHLLHNITSPLKR